MKSDVAVNFARKFSGLARSRAGLLALAAAAAGALAGCQDSSGLSHGRAYAPIPSNVVALMQEKDTDSHAPILIRAFKKEAELEIWKLDHHGEYVHLKTYPMCRWSGQLGPKTREGDRQVPEGFYTITPGQMNPNSAYYLSFNVGYPNAFDHAHGFTGGAIMVHGICSSAGCFSMTDEQIEEIYAIAREAFGGGQRAIQMQSLPFRMTAANLAKHRFDPNMRFWKQLKEGSDQFEVSRQETKVSVCGKQYVFGATPANPAASVDADEACPPMTMDPDLKAEVAAKQRTDDAQVAELVAKGVRPVRIVYADGGQHPYFTRKFLETSRPEALAQGPVEIPLDEKGRPLPGGAQMAAAPATEPAAQSPTSTIVASGSSVVAKTPPAAQKPVEASAFAAPEAPAQPSVEQSFFDRVLGVKPAPAPEPAVAPSEPTQVEAPLPPRRQAQGAAVKPQAALVRPPSVITGAYPAVPGGFVAYSPLTR